MHTPTSETASARPSTTQVTPHESHGWRISRRTFIVNSFAAAAALPMLRAAAAPGRDIVHTYRFQSDGKIEVSMIRYIYGTPAPLDGPGLKMIDEKFNFDYKPMLVPEADYIEKLSTVIAGGDIPDIIVFKIGDSNFYKWAGQGAFLPLDDLVTSPDYKTFSYVPESSWNLGRVSGKLFAIPQYYPPYSLTPSIRQDWLDKLGLKMPTSYDELKQVALAFTQKDPTGQGRKTYGIAVGRDINPGYAMGAYWDDGYWSQKDDKGRLIPGTITDANKARIQFLADLWAEGAVTRDFAVIDWATTNKEFYSGKAGIFIGAPRGMSQDYMAALLQIDPGAKPVPIPPFVAPDKSQGFLRAAGAGALTALSAKLTGNDDKTKRILAFLDYCRIPYSQDQQVPSNPDWDWINGGQGKGYEVKDGKSVTLDSSTSPKGLSPMPYLVDVTSWPKKPEDIDYKLGYGSQPIMAAWAGALQDMWTKYPGADNPTNGIVSQTDQLKGTEISDYMSGEFTKMIAGQRGMDTWDKLKQEYLDKGGEQIIQETNDGLAKRNGG